MKFVYRLCIIAVTAAAALAGGGAAAEPVTISRDGPLYAEASSTSAVVTQLKQGASGEAVGKQGAWINVKTGAGAGWLLSTNVRYGTAASAPSGSSGGWNPFARRPSSGSATATIGIRGFDEATIGSAMGEGAPVSAAQLAQLDGFKAEKPDGATFASSKSLRASKVDY